MLKRRLVIAKPESDKGEGARINESVVKKGLMVHTGLSLFKKLNRLYWYERYRSKGNSVRGKTGFTDWYGKYRSTAYQKIEI